MPNSCPLLLLLVATTAVTVGCQRGAARAADSDQPESKRPPLVRVETLTQQSIRRQIETTGYLEAERDVVVLSKVAGRVREIAVSEGGRVRHGDLLLQLDDTEAVAARQQVEIQLQDRRVQAKLADLEVDAAKRRVVQAEIDRDRAEAEYRRLAGQDPDSVSRKALEDAEFEWKSREEALRVAGFNAAKAVLDAEAAQNNIAESEARLDESRARLTEHRITAPFDGVVAELPVDVGEAVSTATPLARVVDLTELVCYIGRPQDELPLVRDAESVLFTPSAYPEREFIGDIEQILPVVDRETGQFQIRMRVRETDTSLLRPGMFINLAILAESERMALMVPKTAILNDGDQAIVFVVRDGRAVRVVLDLGLEQENFVECRTDGDGDLQPGEAVITAGQDDLRDQDPVEVGEA